MSRACLLLVLAAVVASLGSCGSKKKPAPVLAPQTEASAPSEPDSTVYGIAAESGMSTLYLVTSKGDTLVMDRTGEDGSYSEIYGYITDGDSFAVTKKGNAVDGYTLTKAYNLTLLNRFGLDYSIRNGLFVLNGKDTVGIKSVTNDSITIMYSAGATKVYYAKER